MKASSVISQRLSIDMRDERVGDVIYHSTAWRKLRHAYFISQHGLCERCKQPGDVVHHIEHITKDNLNDVSVTLSHSNLELLCHTCHNQEHKQTSKSVEEGYAFDDEGNFIKIKNKK